MFKFVVEYIEKESDDFSSSIIEELIFDDYEHALMANAFWEQNYFVISSDIEEF